MRNAILVLLLLGGSFWGYRKISYQLASPEVRIRLRVAGMVRGFNHTKMVGVLDGFSEDYLDEETGSDRRALYEILRTTFFRELDPTTKHYRFSVEVPEADLEVRVDEDDENQAQIAFHVIFHERKGETKSIYWDARGAADLVQGEDGWQILRTRDLDHDSRVER